VRVRRCHRGRLLVGGDALWPGWRLDGRRRQRGLPVHGDGDPPSVPLERKWPLRERASRTRAGKGRRPPVSPLHKHGAHHDGRRAPGRILIRSNARALCDGRSQRTIATTMDAESLLPHPLIQRSGHTRRSA
jgi:hypothetical protein